MVRSREDSISEEGSEKFGAGFQQILISISKLCMHIDASTLSPLTTLFMYVHSQLCHNLKHQAFDN